MARDFLILRLTRNDTEAVRTTFQQSIDGYFSPNSGCLNCRLSKAKLGCFQHSAGIAMLRDLRRRFQFPRDGGSIQLDESLD